MKLKTSWRRLMQLASEVGKAKKSGDPQRIKEAEEAHEAYRQMCLQADEIIMDSSISEILNVRGKR